MEPIRRVIAGAREYLGKMTASQKLLMGSIGVIAAMTLFLVVQYSARTPLVELYGEGDAAIQQTTLTQLKGAGIPAERVDGKIMVPEGYQTQALSQLAQSGSLPNDTTLLFANLLDRQNFYNSKQQNEQAWMVALQNELSRVLRNFNGIRDANVILDVPPPNGIGRSVREPTASATVWTSSGGALDQGQVDAVAELVAGARAGLKVENVRVIDASVGRQRRPTSPDQVYAASYLEHTAAEEERLQRKLSDLLGHIRGVAIAVTAQVDVKRSNTQTTKYLNNKEGSVQLLSKQTSTSTTQGQASKGGQPGVQPNAQGNIFSSSGGGGGSTLEDTMDEAEYTNGLGTETKTEQDPGGLPTLLTASVNVPRSYIADLIRAEAGEGEEPDLSTGAISARFAAEQQTIIEAVQPHLIPVGETEAADGAVVVSMIPVDLPPLVGGAAQAGLFGSLAGGGSGGGMLGGGLIEQGLLALLAVGALGMMFMMVRKATKPTELPSPEELSGVPPTLPTVNDMVGEADESEAAMTGIEVNDDEVRSRKLVEQVIEMVGTNPDSAANLLGRWVSEEH